MPFGNTIPTPRKIIYNFSARYSRVFHKFCAFVSLANILHAAKTIISYQLFLFKMAALSKRMVKVIPVISFMNY